MQCEHKKRLIAKPVILATLWEIGAKELKTTHSAVSSTEEKFPILCKICEVIYLPFLLKKKKKDPLNIIGKKEIQGTLLPSLTNIILAKYNLDFHDLNMWDNSTLVSASSSTTNLLLFPEKKNNSFITTCMQEICITNPHIVTTLVLNCIKCTKTVKVKCQRRSKTIPQMLYTAKKGKIGLS